MRKPIHEETICCNSKRCPVLRVFDDDSIEIHDADVGGEPIKFDREQAKLLRARLMEKLP